MTTKIIMVNRESLYVMPENHRQTGARKIIGQEWIEGLPPLVIGQKDENGKYPIFNGARRWTYLSGVQAFPCIVSSLPYSSPMERQEAIEKHKGDSLALSLKQVVDFGMDKVKWNLGKYLARDGESLFLADMSNFYEDYHPSSFADIPEGDDKEIKKARKKLLEFHKGLSALVYRASMLGGEFAEKYVSKAKGITAALREAFNDAKTAQVRGLSWDESKLEALPKFQQSLASYSSPIKKDKQAAIDTLSLIVSINECADINGTGKEIGAFIVGHLDNANGILLQRLATWYPAGK